MADKENFDPRTGMPYGPIYSSTSPAKKRKQQQQVQGERPPLRDITTFTTGLPSFSARQPAFTIASDFPPSEPMATQQAAAGGSMSGRPAPSSSSKAAKSKRAAKAGSADGSAKKQGLAPLAANGSRPAASGQGQREAFGTTAFSNIR